LPCLLVRVLSRTVVEPSHDAARAWNQFARELATMEDVVTQLLIEHVPDAAGTRCTRCTTPGRGTPDLRWPCALYTLARSAQRIRGTWTSIGTEQDRSRRSRPT
jgi:hypothetical protein